MKVSINLALRTREVFKLFERTINGDRLFIDAILHKFNIIMSQCKQEIPGGLAAFHRIEQAMHTITGQFSDEIKRFEGILAKQNELGSKKINIIVQFHPTITVSNVLSIHLVEFIEVYDKLIAVLKLLYLVGCFASNDDYYSNIKRIQTLANRMLSHVILIPSKIARIPTLVV